MEEGRVALVTGGIRGIGAAICTALARSGHRVAVNYHSREAAANSVTPGAIRTDAELEMFPDQDDIAHWLSEEQAVPRRGLPEDIAAAVDYLVSERAAFISGQTLNVEGGWAMH